MLTATPASNGAPADSAARPTGAPLSVALAAPGLRGMRSAARPEGREMPIAALCSTQPDKQETFAPYVAAVK